MDFDGHEEQEEEIGIVQPPENYANSGREKMGSSGDASSRKASGSGVVVGGGGSSIGNRYRECLKNHAVGIGGHAVDGCGEFMAAGEEGTLDALRCAACNCHRNFHRKETEGLGFHQFSTTYSYNRGASHPSGYLHLTQLPHLRPPTLALPSTSRDDEDMSNPSSSGGDGSKKRFRTKFTQEQKDKMLTFSERLGWRIQKHDETDVEQFCAEIGINRHVLKVWMHNNKSTLCKNPNNNNNNSNNNNN